TGGGRVVQLAAHRLRPCARSRPRRRAAERRRRAATAAAGHAARASRWRSHLRHDRHRTRARRRPDRARALHPRAVLVDADSPSDPRRRRPRHPDRAAQGTRPAASCPPPPRRERLGRGDERRDNAALITASSHEPWVHREAANWDRGLVRLARLPKDRTQKSVAAAGSRGRSRFGPARKMQRKSQRSRTKRTDENACQLLPWRWSSRASANGLSLQACCKHRASAASLALAQWGVVVRKSSLTHAEYRGPVAGLDGASWPGAIVVRRAPHE